MRSRIDRFLVSRDWESYFSRVIQSTLSFGGLKDILKAWNKEVFSNVGTMKVEAMHRVVCYWDNQEKEKELSLEESEESQSK